MLKRPHLPTALAQSVVPYHVLSRMGTVSHIDIDKAIHVAINNLNISPIRHFDRYRKVYLEVCEELAGEVNKTQAATLNNIHKIQLYLIKEHIRATLESQFYIVDIKYGRESDDIMTMIDQNSETMEYLESKLRGRLEHIAQEVVSEAFVKGREDAENYGYSIEFAGQNLYIVQHADWRIFEHALNTEEAKHNAATKS